MESSRSVDSLPLTPADEHSSWLGDDVCANCGASVHAGHLYCSQQCRQQDAAAATRAAQLSTAKTALASAASAAVGSSAIETAKAAASTTSPSPPLNTTSTSAPVDKFRYPCPPSPSIMAKYSAALTSPALTALERSMPRDSKAWNGGEAQTGQSRAPASTRRSSSRSTYSSTSEAMSTDPSTPSPALVSSHRGNGADDDIEDWEPTDLHLPPSVVSPSNKPSAATAFLLTKSHNKEKGAAGPALHSSAASTTPPRKAPGPAMLAKKDIDSSNKEGNAAAMSFARRPSSTNLPPPVLFTSPVLATTIKSSHVQGNARNANLQLSSFRRRSEDKILRASPPTSFKPDTAALAKRQAEALPMSSTKSIDQGLSRKPSWSPPQLASAASSAGKTLKAMSPLTSVLPMVQTVCGRFGCQGASSHVAPLSEAQAVPSRSYNKDRTGHDEVTVPRSAMMSRHKHTHSAIAGLQYRPAASPRDEVKTQQERTKPTNSSPPFKDEEERIVPSRGRSHARGRRSVSRRSPSPPRGAARRGRSEDLLMSRHLNRATPSAFVAVEHSASPSSTDKSGPISISRDDAAGRQSSSGASGSVVAESHRRGRSPGVRNKGSRRAASPLPSASSPVRKPTSRGRDHVRLWTETCEMAWPAYGHDQSDNDVGSNTSKALATHAHEQQRNARLDGEAAAVVAAEAGGYDDVDLDEL